MGQLRKIWTDGKSQLTKEQQAKMPKENFGGMCDDFEATCAKAVKKLDEANQALWEVFVDGEDEKGDKSVRKILESYTRQIAAIDKQIAKDMALTIVDVDRAKAGFLKKVMLEYGKLKETAKRLAKYEA
jgi:hypothetical protein